MKIVLYIILWLVIGFLCLTTLYLIDRFVWHSAEPSVDLGCSITIVFFWPFCIAIALVMVGGYVLIIHPTTTIIQRLMQCIYHTKG